MSADATIIEKIREAGITSARLADALAARDGWGGMVHAFEFLTVLGIVSDAMKAVDA